MKLTKIEENNLVIQIMETNNPILTLQTMRRMKIMRKIGTREKKRKQWIYGRNLHYGTIGNHRSNMNM